MRLLSHQNALNQIRWPEILMVTLFWMLLMILVPLGWDFDFPNAFWIKQIIFALVLAIVYSLNGLFWAPKIERIGLLRYGLIVIVVTFLVLIGMQAIEHLLNLPELMHRAIRPERPFKGAPLFRFDFPGMIMTLLSLGISTIITLVRKSQQDAIHREELEKQRASNELAFLKAQINPHFFFNTLNSIYALTSIDLESAQDAIHTLSSMMRHVLYESRKDHTLISQEIKFIENYVELMRLRVGENVTISLEKPGTLNDEMIAPMMFLPFVENAFKHGISAQHQSTIDLKISQENHTLYLYVANQVFERSSKDLDESGIGLTNTKRRLELIYPDRHELKVEEKDKHFTVELSIELS